MLADFNEFVIDKDPDLLTGWNSSSNDIGTGFDWPYLLNRCERINEWTYQNLAYENGRIFVTNRGSAVIGGREMFDMLQAYKKTQIHEKRSYSLNYIASEELGYGKEDIEDIDEGWLHNPVKFMRYNIRDTEAVVEIEKSKSVLKMYDHIRSITGATYSEIADSNIGIIDILFLKQAKDRGYALPTSERPDVQHYWGAYVFDPDPGKHRNVVYPDLSSLYPNLFKDMNASPETIIGDEEALKRSQYTEDQCHTIYVDRRDESTKRSADEPVRSELYVLKPEVQESFVREIVQDLIDMKYEYKKDEYSDQAYAAVKRITNSIYGCMGDSVSYGVGFRLFDWRIAEAITLAGRDVIKHTAEQFENYVKRNDYHNASIIAGDTDSCVCEIPSAESMEETLGIAQEAANYVDRTYESYMSNRFGMDKENMAVEIESYASTALLMDKKKRYAQRIRWDEGEHVDEIEYKGFELVRSDSAEITASVQRGIIDRILTEDEPKDAVSEYLKAEWEAVLNGDVSLDELGVPSAINNDLMDYGWSVQELKEKDAPIERDGEVIEAGDEVVKFYTPQPGIRGARYVKTNIDGEDPALGNKPLMFYVETILPNSPIPEIYDYEDELSLNAPENKPYFSEREMVEVGNQVDAICVEDVRSIPPHISIDFEKMGKKTIRSPVEPITTVMGWNFDEMVSEGSQSNLAQYM
jgi:DNA polymerase elongation subunit (family B)